MEIMLLLLCALALASIWQQQWLGLAAAAFSAAILWAALNPSHGPTSSNNDTSPPAAEEQASPASTAQTGVELMADAIIPIWSRQLAAIQASVQSGTVELLTCFSSVLGLQDQLSGQIQSLSAEGQNPQALEQLTQLGQEIQTQCENALHGLQFGDRVSQMVDILQQNTERFSQQLSQMSQAQSADVQAWLSALEATYTTDEQRLFHHGQPQEPKHDNVEYF
ncbi:hypothetical protein WG899_12845 [Paucibacter sp. AS339]|uniref:hypothetical protein n=1 Tax=Paucibacter hankyongi TaxID=3133434 RepID=UPI0030B3F23D